MSLCWLQHGGIFLRKLIITFSLVIVILTIMVIPAFGVGVDYHDFITNMTIGSDGTTVYISLPLDHVSMTASYNGSTVVSASGTRLSWSANSSYSYNVWCYLMGGTVDTKLDATYIPDGTLLQFGFGFTSTRGISNPQGRTVLYQLNNVGSEKKVQYSSYTTFPADGSITSTSAITLSKHGETSVLRPAFQLTGLQPLSSGTLTLNVTSCTLVMTIPALVEEQYQSQRTNKILEAVELKLAENGQKLDDILSGETLDHSKIDDFDNDIHNIGSDIDSAIEDINNSFEFVSPTVPDVMGLIDMEVVGNINAVLMPVWDNSLFLSLLLISLGLMLVGYVLFGKR